jgi:BirA family biotin operon repressor/biotin-[acetyl-CoA-carboxylase] ligase
MVNISEKTTSSISTKAYLLIVLREKAGEPISGGVLATDMGISRVAVWKGVQSLCEAGYPIETLGSGYSLDPQKDSDFLYPWEFGERESMFRHFESTDSTMDRAREFAIRGLVAGTVITAEKQKAGRGRNGRAWASQKGGLFCTIIDRPTLAVVDYFQSTMVMQIAVARTLTSLCGKPARLRWPNDVYIEGQKIAGLMTDVHGEGDAVCWLATGIGVNVNNSAPSQGATSCAEIVGHPVSRRDVLLRNINEAEKVKKRTKSTTAYTQGNRLIAAEWNSLADRIGAKAAVFNSKNEKKRVLAKGIFSGIDATGRCIIKPETGKETMHFNPGPASLVFYS